MALKEKFLYDPKAHGGVAKRVIVSDSPSAFSPANSKVGARILGALAAGEMYPAQVARALSVHHQTVYYHISKLEKAGLVARISSERVRGGEATRFALTSDGYAVEFAVKGERFPGSVPAPKSKALSRFFAEFVKAGALDGWVVVGSPLEHGESGTQARDGHYAVQLGFALGQFVALPARFPVKLDVDVKAERLEGDNMVIVGGPRTNVVAQAVNQHLPARFKQGGFWGSISDDEGRSYSSELDAIVAKVPNPWNPESTCIVAAGLTGAGTKAAIISMTNFADETFRNYTGGDFACILRGADRDGDGKVDSADVLRRL